MIRRVLPLLALLTAAAAPAGSFNMATPMPDFSHGRAPPAPATAPPGYVTAPTPDNEAAGPQSRASKDASVGPGVFSRRDQYRGEGLSASSSAQTGQNRRAMPGAGLKLSMPIQ